jgi:tRNA-binding EMAP/Myf-like protein
MPEWTCPECEFDNEATAAECDGCGEARPAGDAAGASAADKEDPYYNIVVGIVVEAAPVPNKDKLLALIVDIGDGNTLPIVTNAGNVVAGSRVVIAKVGATVNEVEVRKANVGGAISEGMLCDAPMLGWVGGGAGAAALVPESFAPGARPPQSRPRMN